MLPEQKQDGIIITARTTFMPCRGIERALDQIEAERGQQTEAALNTGPALPRSDSAKKEEVKRSVMREKRASAWKHLSLNERDVLTVLSAVCKARRFIAYKSDEFMRQLGCEDAFTIH